MGELNIREEQCLGIIWWRPHSRLQSLILIYHVIALEGNDNLTSSELPECFVRLLSHLFLTSLSSLYYCDLVTLLICPMNILMPYEHPDGEKGLHSSF